VAGASVDTSGAVAAGVSVSAYNVVQNDPQRLGLDPTTQAAINQAPMPNNFTLGDGLNTAGYTFATGLSERQHDQVIKIDHNFSATNSVFFRGAWAVRTPIAIRSMAGSPSSGDRLPGQHGPRASQSCF
jgi:hypothetical protein